MIQERSLLRDFRLVGCAGFLVGMLTACSAAQDCEASYRWGQTDPPGVALRTNIARLMIAACDGSSNEQLFPNYEESIVTIWAPDGGRVITYGLTGHPFVDEYYVTDMVGGAPVCLTCGGEAREWPVWSPSGDRIAVPVETGLYIEDPQGVILTRIDLPSAPLWASWAPDGGSLVLTTWRPAGLQIFRVDADGANLTNLSEVLGASPGDAFAAQWSPVGDLIAFHSLVGGGHIAVMNPDGSGQREVARWQSNRLVLEVPGWQPHWSPDGQQIAFASDSAFGDLDIFVVRPDGSGLRNITSNPGDDYNPVWSPDGQRIAFVSTRDGDEEVYVANADGSDPVNVSQHPGAFDGDPAFRPRPAPDGGTWAIIAVIAGGAGVISVVLILGLRRRRRVRP